MLKRSDRTIRKQEPCSDPGGEDGNILGIGLDRFCVCPRCGFKALRPAERHCDEVSCPKCGTAMRLA